MIQHYTMLQRNLLYTGGTKGSKLVVLEREGPSPSRSATSRDGGAAFLFFVSQIKV
jgi:hypothetical protein